MPDWDWSEPATASTASTPAPPEFFYDSAAFYDEVEISYDGLVGTPKIDPTRTRVVIHRNVASGDGVPRAVMIGAGRNDAEEA